MVTYYFLKLKFIVKRILDEQFSKKILNHFISEFTLDDG